MNARALAPEALDGIRAAQEALEREAERLEATGDPTAPGIAAQASAVKALHRLMVDVFLKTQTQQEETARLIQEGRKMLPLGLLDAMQVIRDDIKVSLAAAVKEIRQPVAKDTMRELLRQAVFQMDHSLAVRAISLQRSVIAGAGAAAVALVAIGWLAGGWWHPRGDISGMTCADQPRGGRVCYVWISPPPQ